MSHSRSWNLYAQILAGTKEPATTNAISEKVGVSQNNARIILRRMCTGGIVHISGWTEPVYPRMPMPLYLFGAGENVPRPAVVVTGRPSTHARTKYPQPKPIAQLVAFCNVVKALRRPCATSEAASMAGTAPQNTARVIKLMRSLGLTHIAAWRRRSGTGGAPPALWQIGLDQQDAPKPKPLTGSEVSQAYRSRKRAQIESEFARSSRLRRLAVNSSVFVMAQSA